MRKGKDLFKVQIFILFILISTCNSRPPPPKCGGRAGTRIIITCRRMGMALLVEIWKKSKILFPSILASRDFNTISPTSFWNKVWFSHQYSGMRMLIPDRDVNPGPEYFHPGSRIQGQRDSGSRVRSASKNLSILTQKMFLSSRGVENMIR